MRMSTVLSSILPAVALFVSSTLPAQSVKETLESLKIPDANCLCQIDMKSISATPIYKSMREAKEGKDALSDMASGFTGGKDSDFRKIFERHGITEGDMEQIFVSARIGDLQQMPAMSPGKTPFDMADIIFGMSISKKLTMDELQAIAKESADLDKEPVEISRESYKGCDIMLTKPAKAQTAAAGAKPKDLAWTLLGDGKLIVAAPPQILRGAIDRVQAKERKAPSPELESLNSAVPPASQFKLLVDLSAKGAAKKEGKSPAAKNQPANPMTMGADAIKDIKSFSVDAELADKINVRVAGCFNDASSATAIQSLLSGMLLPMMKMQMPMLPDGKMTRMAETMKSESAAGSPVVKLSWEMTRQDLDTMRNFKAAGMPGAQPSVGGAAAPRQKKVAPVGGSAKPAPASKGKDAKGKKGDTDMELLEKVVE